MRRVTRDRARAGFTLIELLVVLLILAAVAALVIPILGFARDQADAATAASGSADVMTNVETFKVATGAYPQRMDSLLSNDGGYAEYSRIWHHPGPPSPWFVVEDLSGVQSFGTSLAHAGITTVMDHDETADDANASGAILRPLFGPGAEMSLAVVSDEALLAAAGFIDSDGDGTVDVPDLDGDGPDVKLVAFGIGPQCEIVGRTMTSPPFHSGADPEDYARFIPIFAVYENGKTAQLRLVVDSRRGTINSRLTDYRNAAPE